MGFNNSTKMKILKLLVTSELRQLLVGSSGKAEEGRSLCSSLRRELLQGEQRPPGGKERRARKALWNHRQPQPSFKLQGQWPEGRPQRGEEGLQPGRLQEHEGPVRPEQADLQSRQDKAPLGRGDQRRL